MPRYPDPETERRFEELISRLAEGVRAPHDLVQLLGIAEDRAAREWDEFQAAQQSGSQVDLLTWIKERMTQPRRNLLMGRARSARHRASQRPKPDLGSIARRLGRQSGPVAATPVGRTWIDLAPATVLALDRVARQWGVDRDEALSILLRRTGEGQGQDPVDKGP